MSDHAVGAADTDSDTDSDTAPYDAHPQPAAGPVGVSVVHDVRVPAVLAVGAAVLAVVWFARALGTADPLDWAMCLLPAAVGLLMLAVLRDARAPLLVADDQGVRVRHGVTWTGLRWSDVDRVELRSRAGLRDGELVVHLADAAAEASAAEPGEEPGAREFRVPLGVGTRVETEGLTGNLVEDLDSLAAGLVPMVVLTPAIEEPEQPEPEPEAAAEPDEEPDEEPEPAPVEATAEAAEEPEVDQEVISERIRVVVLPSSGESFLPEQAGPVDERPESDAQLPAASAPAVTDAGPTPAVGPVRGLEPGRPTRDAARTDVVRERVRRLPDPPAIPAQRAGEGPVVTARLEDIDGSLAPQPAPDPVIGPVVAAARHRARLSIDTLSERTRIRPHVLECLEVDDFEACGGDFYARGHLRTLARTFGLDGEALVATYDERYASPEIEAKQVFEAELASGIGGGVRAATHGPRWSMLAAAVVLLVGIWGAARVFSDTPQELVSPAPDVVDTAGLAGEKPAQPQVALGSIEVTAEGASPQVAIRDGGGRILFADAVADGQSVRVVGTGPFDVTTSNGSAVRVTYLGEDRGTVGDTDQGDARRFG